MPPWMLKAAMQGTLSRLPSAERWNLFFQKYVTRSLALTDECILEKWRKALGHLSSYRSHSLAPRDSFSALEIGTGWHPIVPVALALSGGGPVYTLDRRCLLNGARLKELLARLARLISSGMLTCRREDAVDRLEETIVEVPAPDPRKILDRLDVHVLIGDARRLSLPDGAVDLLVSNNTLEHIPSDGVADIFCELGRVARDGAVMSHHIDMSDHYANFDRSISVLHFLAYSETVWRLFNNDLQYQNRLRRSDYRALHEATGWRVVEERDLAADPELLRHLALAPQFRRYPEEDLLIYETWMVSRRGRSHP